MEWFKLGGITWGGVGGGDGWMYFFEAGGGEGWVLSPARLLVCLSVLLTALGLVFEFGKLWAWFLNLKRFGPGFEFGKLWVSFLK